MYQPLLTELSLEVPRPSLPTSDVVLRNSGASTLCPQEFIFITFDQEEVKHCGTGEKKRTTPQQPDALTGAQRNPAEKVRTANLYCRTKNTEYENMKTQK